MSRAMPSWTKVHNVEGWSPCTACDDPHCDTIWRECVHGCISITPQFFGGYLKVMSARGQQVYHCAHMDEALKMAETESQVLGGWHHKEDNNA